MQKQLTCNQVNALLSFYVEDKLNEQLKKYIEYHLSICPECYEKYQKLKKLVNNFTEISKKINSDEEDEFENPYINRQYEDFKSNLSAYIDNELTDEENLRIKKIAISNPIARKDLEDIYTFKRLLHSSFDKTKNNAKEDFSKNVLSQIYSMHTANKLDPFYLIMTIFTVIIAVALLGIANLLIF
ncbi:hypothetical protein DBY21_08500 [Candidatus Gastranaerophilales bacterium]|nr:MAG: hypothetical protein DBY21_08500 [Candidatus Gastranaerophilales bacterium]